MNRSKQMDDFLQYWAQIYAQNPQYPIDKNVLYKSLMDYGLTAEEQANSQIDSLFSVWKNYFQNNPSLKVYEDARQPYFLQFMSRGDLGRQHVKLYLSYPADKIEYCVKRIFEFVAANHMTTGSKVSDRLRSDSVVLRMTNYEDAIKVINFISSEPELLKYAKPTNPFMMKNGVVGVSYDDNLSYNGALAFMLAQYFMQCRHTGTLKNANHRTFREYANQYSNLIFKDRNALSQFCSNPEISGMLKRFGSVGEALVNYDQVFKLMVAQLDERMSMERFRSFYVDAKNSSRNKELADYYNELLKSPEKNTNPLERTASMEEIALINSYIQFAIKKYGNRETVIAYLRKYIEEDNINAITRDGDFRTKFYKGMNPKRASFIMMHNVDAYVYNVLKEVEEAKKEPEVPFAERLLQSYIDLARRKYGDAGSVAYLMDYCKGNMCAITKENNFRAQFIQYLPPQKVSEIVNNNIKEYIRTYIEKQAGNSMSDETMYENFINACRATYQKYGRKQLAKAIECGVDEKFTYFTNGEGRYRENMVFLTSELFIQCCKRLLSMYGTNLSSPSELSEKCCDAIEQLINISIKEEQEQKRMG